MITREEFDYRRIQLAYEFGRSVRNARQSRGWSIAGFARRADVTRAEIAAIEAGTPMPPAVTARIATAAGIDAPAEGYFATQ
ncbi:helix-turn-helix transcriptional regulator [Nocardia sp. NPDC051030]|uniref:helix-turn-helix domain-containing protein n=1 Tax=Nocardia sp. NPDC051030 TaxID=3155162 RepID=UPI00342B4C91